GFAGRLAWMLYAQPEPISDFADYRSLAVDLVEHGQYGFPEPTARRPPGYPFFLAGMMLISRSVWWLSLANVVVSSCTCLLVYLLAKYLFQSTNLALVSAFLCSVNPQFVAYSPTLASENVFPLLILGATVMVIYPQSDL